MSAQKLLIRNLGGPYAVAPLLDPPVDQCLVRRWADGWPMPAARLDQIRRLQQTRNKTVTINQKPQRKKP